MHDDLPKSKYSREQLITARQNEYEFLIHEDFEPEVDLTASEDLEYLNSLYIEQLIRLTDCDDVLPLDDYMSRSYRFTQARCMPLRRRLDAY